MTNEPPGEELAHSESAYHDEEFVEAIRDLGGSATIFAIIEAVGAPFPTTYDRLQRLMLRDELEYQLEEDGGMGVMSSILAECLVCPGGNRCRPMMVLVHCRAWSSVNPANW